MTKILTTIFVLCVSICVVFAKHEQYEGYALYRVSAQDSYQATFANKLERQIPIDIWMPTQPGRPGQFFVPKDYREQFEKMLSANNVKFTNTNTNIKKQLEEEERLLAAAAMKKTKRSGLGLSYDEIHRLRVVDAYIDTLGEAYPHLVEVVTAGRSFEGRPIKYLKISTTNFQDKSKPVVFVHSLLHAREWVTLPATLYAIEKLVLNVTDTDLQNEIDWIIMPVANPDGYEFSHVERFWRKNRASVGILGTFCKGVDLNRNFDINWSTESEFSPCSEIYHGRFPFSEPETQAIERILHEHKSRLELYIDLHSFGSMILFGYGNGTLPDNSLTLTEVGVSMAKAIDRVKWSWKPDYIVGHSYEILYASSGSTDDYVRSIGVPLAYTYELPAYRNMNDYIDGFLVDPAFIEQAGFETWEGIKAGARFVINNRKENNL